MFVTPLLEKFSWGAVTMLWVIVCALAACLSALAYMIWKKYWTKQDTDRYGTKA